MLIPQELQLSRHISSDFATHTMAQFENLGELVKNTIFVA